MIDLIGKVIREMNARHMLAIDCGLDLDANFVDLGMYFVSADDTKLGEARAKQNHEPEMNAPSVLLQKPP